MSVEEVKEIQDKLYYMAFTPEYADVLRKALELIRTHPEAQPNEPLTLEELREMDGQPVWVKNIYLDSSGWALVSLLSDGDIELYCACGERWILSHDDSGCDPDEDEIEAVYRRPPKEET